MRTSDCEAGVRRVQIRAPGCYWASQPVYDGLGRVVGYMGRPVQVCPGYVAPPPRRRAMQDRHRRRRPLPLSFRQNGAGGHGGLVLGRPGVGSATGHGRSALSRPNIFIDLRDNSDLSRIANNLSSITCGSQSMLAPFELVRNSPE
jgi:hypothetical protein